MPIVSHFKFFDITESLFKSLAEEHACINYETRPQVMEDYREIQRKLLYPLNVYDDYEEYISSYTKEDMKDIRLILVSYRDIFDYDEIIYTKKDCIHTLHFLHTILRGEEYIKRIIDTAYENERKRRLQTPKQVIRRSTRNR